MVRADWPCAVVNTGSKQGITLPPGDTAYNVSKAGLKALSESLAHDLLQTGGRVSAHLLIPGFTFTGFTRARGVAEKPPGAWTPEQVIDDMLPAMAAGDSYILCPDNEATPDLDKTRIAWSAGDLIDNRPALSRWHPEFSEVFKAHMEGAGRKTGFAGLGGAVGPAAASAMGVSSRSQSMLKRVEVHHRVAEGEAAFERPLFQSVGSPAE